MRSPADHHPRGQHGRRGAWLTVPDLLQLCLVPQLQSGEAFTVLGELSPPGGEDPALPIRARYLLLPDPSLLLLDERREPYTPVLEDPLGSCNCFRFGGIVL